MKANCRLTKDFRNILQFLWKNLIAKKGKKMKILKIFLLLILILLSSLITTTITIAEDTDYKAKIIIANTAAGSINSVKFQGSISTGWSDNKLATSIDYGEWIKFEAYVDTSDFDVDFDGDGTADVSNLDTDEINLIFYDGSDYTFYGEL